jgi:hypothetical protein
MKLVDVYIKNASCQYKSDYVYKSTVTAKTCKEAKEFYLLKNRHVDSKRVKCNFNRWG